MEEKEKNKEPEQEVKTEQAAEQKQEEKSRERDGKNADNGGLTGEQQKKLITALSYVFGILFFLPLIMYPNDEFAKFHANQGLAVLITAIIGEVIFGVLSLIPVLKTVFGILCGIFGAAILILCILGVINVVNGEKKELPLIGKIRLLK